MAENEQPSGAQGTDQQQIDWRQRHDQLAQQYQQDMEKVYTALTAQQQQQPQQMQPQQQEPEWDVTDPKQLKQNVERSLQSTVQTTLTPVVLALAKNQFDSHMLAASRDERMPYFRYWENEIRQLAQGVQPGLLAEYPTIMNLYALVASRHANELVELEVKKRMAAQQEHANSDEVEVEEESQPEPAASVSSPSSGSPPPSPRQPVQQARETSTQPPRSMRQASTRRLTREQAFMAERMGMSLKEYAQALDLGDVEL